MAFLEGFIEDDEPALPPCPPAPPQQQPVIAPSPSTSKRPTPMLDLTASPPPEQKRMKVNEKDKTRALEDWFGSSQGGGGGAPPPLASSSSRGAAGEDRTGMAGTRRVVHTGAPPPPTYSALLPQHQQGQARGMSVVASPTSTTTNNNNNGFARFAQPSYQAQASSSSSSSSAGPSRSQSHPSPRAQPQPQPQGGFTPFAPPPQGRIPIISSASSARLPSRALSGPSPIVSTSSSRAGQPPSRTSSTGSASGKNYYKLQSTAVSASMTALAKQGVIPPPPGKRQSSLNALSASSSSHNANAIAGPSRSNSLNTPSTTAAAASRGPKAGSSTGMIDLTSLNDDASSSDDSDLVIDDPPICIGQITSLALILYPVAELLPPIPVDSSGRPLPPELAARAPPPILSPLPVHILRAEPQGQNETLKLVTPGSRETFGVMEHRVANVVAGLFGEGWTGTGTGVELNKGGRCWCEASVVRRAEKNPMMLPLHLLLFTRRSSIPSISSHLEKATIYLEHPGHYNPSLHRNHEYLNPHNPAQGVGGAGRGREPLGAQFAGGWAGGGQRREGANVEVMRNKVDQVFREMKTGADLDEVLPPSIISTPLYPHQAQALSFLLDREALLPVPARDLNPHEPTMVSLWQRVSDTYGRAVGWRSLVAEREIEGAGGPPQARGAILADDMGLGKTIVVISLVACTLNVARAWASLPFSKEAHDVRLDSIRDSAASKKSSASLADFSSNLYGLVGNGEVVGTIKAPPITPGGVSIGANGKALSKKAAAKRKREEKKDNEGEMRFSKLVTRSRATLIVCPLSTVQNWEQQFEEHTTGLRPGEGGTGGVRIKEIMGEDGSVTKVRFDVEEEEAEREGVVLKERMVKMEGLEGAAEEGKGKGKARAVKSTRRNDDDAFGAGGDDQSMASRSDSDSDDDSPSKRRPALSIYIYHGNARLADPRKLADFDVVITTFSTLGTEFSKQTRAEEEREEAAKRGLQVDEESEDEPVQVYGFDERGEVIETKPGEEIVQAGKPLKKKKVPKRPRKKVEGSGVSPLQQIQWFRVVLDEAHIIKEHSTIQARAACDLAAARRIALSGTPLQNSLNDLFSLVRFLRLEPFTDRPVWTQFIGSLVKAGDPLGVERLQLVMRHLTLRRTKESLDKHGKPILSLPPVSHKIVRLKLDPAEHAFYQSHHLRYKHAFEKLEETDSVMKNFCSILQEILRLRQICVHMALVKDAEDVGGDLIETIQQHGISKTRAIQLLALMKDAGAAQCVECGTEMLAGVAAGAHDAEEDVKSDVKRKTPSKRARKPAAGSATASAVNSEDDHHHVNPHQGVDSSSHAIVTRCQHLFCRPCFTNHVYKGWGEKIVATDRAACSVCKADMTPALDAVEIGAEEFERAMEESRDEVVEDEDEKPRRGGKTKPTGIRKEKKAKTTRFFEHSTKTRALIDDLLPFSRANPASSNYRGGMNMQDDLTEETGGTIGFQPVKGEVVKSVVFSQWTKLLDRLGDALENENIGFYRLDGGMNRDQRTRAMEAFKADPRCEALLVSLRAGGVGLNLTAGRRVYLMEPFWNPAVENQAVDRVYRLGQTMPVQTVRFIIDKSVEERMLDIQKKKTDLANASLKQTKSKAELAKERIADMKHLLG